MSVMQVTTVIDGHEQECRCFVTCVTSSEGVAGMHAVSVRKMVARIIHVINIMAETGVYAFLYSELIGFRNGWSGWSPDVYVQEMSW